MDLQALRARIRTMASVNDPNIVDDDYIDALANEAHQDVVSSRDWPFLFDEQVVTSSGREVTLPQPVRQVEAVLFGSIRLTPESPTDLDLEEDNPADEDPSVYVRRDETTLLLWPAPSEDVQIVVRGLLAPVDMEADADEPMFGSEFHHIVAYAAAARLLGEIGDESGRRDAFISEVESTFMRMERRYMRSADKYPTQAGGQARRRRVQLGRGIGRSGGHSTSHGGSGGVPAHTHDSIEHDHDGEYAGLVHNHDGTYSVLGHDHDAVYEALGHDHDADYASQSTADLLTASPLNVKDPQFGAVGDGVADDTAALQAALDAAAAAGGAGVFMPAGTYRITAKLEVEVSDLTLFGLGGAVIDGTEVPVDTEALRVTGTEGDGIDVVTMAAQETRDIEVADDSSLSVGDTVVLRSMQPWDLSREPNETYTLSERHVVHSLLGANVVRLERRVAYDWDHGTHPVKMHLVDPVRNVRLEGFRLTMGGEGDDQRGIRIDHFEDAIIHRVRVTDSWRRGLQLARGTGGIISNCTVDGSDRGGTGYAVSIMACENTAVVGCTLSESRRGVDVTGHEYEYGLSRSIAVVGNAARNMRTTGFGSHAAADGVLFADNVVDGASGGFVCRSATTTIRGNVVRNLEMRNDYPDDLAFSYGAVVGVAAGAGNTHGPSGPGGVVAGWRTTVADNVFEGGLSGVWVSNIDVEDVVIADNVIRGFEEYGIRVGHLGDRDRVATDVKITGNRVDKITPEGSDPVYGVALFSEHHNVVVAENWISNVDTAAFRFEGSNTAGTPNTNVLVRDNVIQDVTFGGGRGVDALTGEWDGLEVVGNRFLGAAPEIPYRLPDGVLRELATLPALLALSETSGTAAADNTWVQVPMSLESNDEALLWSDDGGAAVAGADLLMSYTGALTWAPGVAGSPVDVKVVRYDSTDTFIEEGGLVRYDATSTGGTKMHTGVRFKLDAGDKVYLEARQQSGSGVTINEAFAEAAAERLYL